jgi:hypothetical protein
MNELEGTTKTQILQSAVAVHRYRIVLFHTTIFFVVPDFLHTLGSAILKEEVSSKCIYGRSSSWGSPRDYMFS